MVHCFAFVASCLALQQQSFSSTTMTMSSTMSSTSSSSTIKPLRSLGETLSSKRWLKSGDSDTIQQRTAAMKERTAALAPLTDQELDDIIYSIQNLNDSNQHALDYNALRTVLQETAHLSHKDWAVTQANGERLAQVLLPQGAFHPSARPLLDRILTEGNWDGAVQHASKSDDKNQQAAWAVLVTGVNGIRKTTSLYQEWFPQLLAEALVPPSSTAAEDAPTSFDVNMLPSGRNSFFRQLDHMIATLCNEDFCILYQLTAELLEQEGVTPAHALEHYADLKAGIFGRYRTLSELLGGALLKQAQQYKANCLMETSGRDVAMFHYVNHFFGDQPYHKLALHFTINDLSYACDSVDKRMQGELESGLQALQQESATAVVHANAGGPYGSAVLAGVQAASDAVWETDVLPATSPVAADWYKATIQINAHATEPWTAQAVRPDGTLGTVFTFAPKNA